MPIFWKEKVFLLAPETTYGTAPTLSAGDAVLASNITLSPMEGEDVSRELELPQMGAQGTIPVNLHAKLTFSVELVGTGTAGQIPPIGKLLRACAMAEVKETTKVTYTPVSRGHESVTVHLWIGDTRYALTGSMGTATIRVAGSAIPKVEFEMTGLFTMPSKVTPPTPTLTAQIDAPVLVATTQNTPTFTINNRPFVMRSFALALGNQVETRFLIGSDRVLITGKSETIETTVEAEELNVFNPFQIGQARTRVPVKLVHGTANGNRVTIEAPKAQMQRLTGLEENQGIKEWPLRLIPMLTAGNDQFSIMFN
ncbi:MAG: phage tail tube protein [Paracoccus sp. (in: a-proteobacteria)]|uniref:phage tail tube protein n=1 Tax=Paracoccus sp. TaxID=267 RepID=UPI0026E06CAC|nr:phage tail tube protein [Paracoccus sp. (in: a-proteobacteria)]MDO5614451.1 phage tail tube protein [Paracoccus sp. (in: a-proteobacteria)]